jgi:hypothetical protein
MSYVPTVHTIQHVPVYTGSKVRTVCAVRYVWRHSKVLVLYESTVQVRVFKRASGSLQYRTSTVQVL